MRIPAYVNVMSTAAAHGDSVAWIDQLVVIRTESVLSSHCPRISADAVMVREVVLEVVIAVKDCSKMEASQHAH